MEGLQRHLPDSGHEWEQLGWNLPVMQVELALHIGLTSQSLFCSMVSYVPLRRGEKQTDLCFADCLANAHDSRVLRHGRFEQRTAAQCRAITRPHPGASSSCVTLEPWCRWRGSHIGSFVFVARFLVLRRRRIAAVSHRSSHGHGYLSASSSPVEVPSCACLARPICVCRLCPRLLELNQLSINCQSKKLIGPCGGQKRKIPNGGGGKPLTPRLGSRRTHEYRAAEKGVLLSRRGSVIRCISSRPPSYAAWIRKISFIHEKTNMKKQLARLIHFAYPCVVAFQALIHKTMEESPLSLICRSSRVRHHCGARNCAWACENGCTCKHRHRSARHLRYGLWQLPERSWGTGCKQRHSFDDWWWWCGE